MSIHVHELKQLKMYNSKNKLIIPLSDNDNKKESVIYLLTPNIESSVNMIKSNTIINAAFDKVKRGGVRRDFPRRIAHAFARGRRARHPALGTNDCVAGGTSSQDRCGLRFLPRQTWWAGSGMQKA